MAAELIRPNADCNNNKSALPAIFFDDFPTTAVRIGRVEEHFGGLHFANGGVEK
jgi:hypothetical protein